MLLPHRPRAPYLRRFVVGARKRSRSRLPIAFYRAIGRQHRSYRIFREHHDVTVPRSERRSVLLHDHRPCFIGIFFQARTPSGSKTNPRRAYNTPSRRINNGSACLHRHATGSFAARILIELPFFLLPLPFARRLGSCVVRIF